METCRYRVDVIWGSVEGSVVGWDVGVGGVEVRVLWGDHQGVLWGLGVCRGGLVQLCATGFGLGDVCKMLG